MLRERIAITIVCVADFLIRCPDCGKRMSADDLKCLACGYGNVTHTPRIRCNYCARRIPASAAVCPNCQHNPRAFYWKRRHAFALLGAALCAAIIFFTTIGANFFGAPLKDFDPLRVIVLGTTPTASATLRPITVIITATPRPATATSAPLTQARIDTAAPRATATSAVSPTITPTLTQISGRPLPTATFTAIPTPIPAPPPKLVAPTDGERVQGANKRIILTFQPAQPIGMQEWYRVQVDYLDRMGQPVSWCAFTKASALEFPRDLFDETSPNARSFLWRVSVVRSTQVAPTTCDAPYQSLSVPSDAWTFYWY